MTALYNEIEPYAARWLDNLINAGHIARGVVDARSITELRATDLVGRTQCHFFAGIGVWSHALRLAGWPDDRKVWTGSCPCQPFSAAGKGGGFADERHLWPAWFALIRECRPSVVFGEQVASPDGLKWLDLVHADLEGAGYAVGTADLCAAGVGAPHIRQRLYFVAHAEEERRGSRRPGKTGTRQESDGRAIQPGGLREAVELGYPRSKRDANNGSGSACDRCVARRAVADANGERFQGGRVCVLAGQPRSASAEAAWRGAVGGMGDAGRDGDQQHAGELPRDEGEHDERGAHGDRAPIAASEARPWDRCDWIPCRDGVFRPVEPGAFPLAHGAAARVGRLRAYGNAIVAQVAATFISAAMSAMEERHG